MNEPPLVTVGVPTYNRPEGLRRALACLARQTYRNLEIVISDNASPGEETTRVIEAFAATDGRVKHIRQGENIGVARNFSFVLDQAAGKYFAWFADDDLCDDTFVETLVTQMESSADIALTMSDVRFVDEVRSTVAMTHLSSIRWEIVRDEWATRRRQFFAYPTTPIFLCVYGLYRTDVLRRCRPNFRSRWKNIAYATEVPFLAQVALQGKIVSVPRFLKTYRSHDDSLYVREQSRITPLDRLIRDTEVRLELTAIALRSGLPWADRLLLGASPWPVANDLAHLLERGWRAANGAA